MAAGSSLGLRSISALSGNGRQIVARARMTGLRLAPDRGADGVADKGFLAHACDLLRPAIRGRSLRALHLLADIGCALDNVSPPFALSPARLQGQ